MSKPAATFKNLERFQDLSCAIIYYRKRRGLSQEQLAERLGISRQHMGAIESLNMNRWPSLELVFNIARELEIEPFLLFKFNPDKSG